MPITRLLVALLVVHSVLGLGCRRQARQEAKEPATAAPPPAPPPAPPYGGPVVEVPAGSRLMLALDDAIDSKRMSAGQRFRSSLQAALLDAGGKVVVPAGTRVFGVIVEAKNAGNVAGKSEVELAFTDLEIQGVLFPIQSQDVKAVGEGSGRDTGRKVAAGALIGAAVGGGNGAAKGAAVGGAAAVLTRGQSIKLPAGTMLELTLLAPAKVPASPESGTASSVPAAGAPATPSAVSPPAAPVATTASATTEPDKDCVKKLMANGFSADEALASCNKKK